MPSSSQSGSPRELFHPEDEATMSEATPPMRDHIPEDENLQVNAPLRCLYHIMKADRCLWKVGRQQFTI